MPKKGFELSNNTSAYKYRIDRLYVYLHTLLYNIHDKIYVQTKVHVLCLN